MNWLSATMALLDAHNGAVTALATASIAVFTLALILVTGRQARMARDALALATREFVSSHRPRIKVRNVFNMKSSDCWHVQVVIVNAGETNATVEVASTKIVIRNATTLAWIDGGGDETIHDTAPNFPPVMASGEPRVSIFRSAVKKDPSSLSDLYSQICVIGKVRYRDDNKAVRETGFFWTWNIVTQRFDPGADHQFSYED